MSDEKATIILSNEEGSWGVLDKVPPHSADIATYRVDVLRDVLDAIATLGVDVVKVHCTRDRDGDMALLLEPVYESARAREISRGGFVVMPVIHEGDER